MSQQIETAAPLARPEWSLTKGNAWVTLWQLAIGVSVFAIWEISTRLPWLAKYAVFDPFFISRPSLIANQIWDWSFGAQAGFIWPHLAETLIATLFGFLLGSSSGFLAGLVLSQHETMHRILNPFIVGLNSMPRIAFIPLITMIFGLGVVSKIVASWMVVFFLVFFNSYKGSKSIDREMINFCRTLGASSRQVAWTVRVPTALQWTFSSLPNAVSFSLIGVVVAEFVGTNKGMGALITTALAALNATEMFAAIFILSIVGILLVYVIEHVERRVMHWSPEHRQAD